MNEITSGPTRLDFEGGAERRPAFLVFAVVVSRADMDGRICKFAPPVVSSLRRSIGATEHLAMHVPFAIESVGPTLIGIAGASSCARSRRSQLGWYGALLVLLLIPTGCDTSGLNLAPVEGVVIFQGRPLQDAGVMFMPVDSTQGPPASGSTNTEGRFTLLTANRPGAVIGNHRVAISKAEAFGAEVPIEQMENPDLIRGRGIRVFKPKYHIPPLYADVEQSGLTATVTEDDNSFQFELMEKN